jgi:hypothetical protein
VRCDKSRERVGANATAPRFLFTAIVCLIVASTRPVAACCQLGGTACGDPFAVSCNNGVVCFPPWRTCPGCTCTATNGGQTCLTTTLEPGRVSTLHVDKNAQSVGDLDLSWGGSCSASGPDYSVHEGQLGVWFSHAPLRCSSGFTASATITPSGGGRYYLIAPIAAGYTGSFGTDSAGSERPDGSPSCTDDRALAPCP